MKSIYALVSLSFLGFFSAQAESNKSLPSEMPLFLESIKKLQPFMISDTAFSDPKNAKTIQEEFDKMKSASKNLSHEDRISEPALKMAARNIGDHLNDLSEAFKISKTYSRYLLSATLDGCSSCHSQVSPSGRPFLHFNPSELKGNEFQKAEFLFAIRQFPEAIKFYEKAIKADLPPQRMQAFVRGLTIYLLQYKDLKKAEAWVKDFPIKHDDEGPIMQDYLKAIQSLKNEKEINIEKASSEDLEAFAEREVNPSRANNLPKQLYTSGILHAYVLAHSKVSAGVYYWLGKSDSALKYKFIFSLTNEYFKRCIEISPKSKQAEKCFSELESSVLVAYEGSAGSHVPADQAKMLNAYRGKAGLASKSYPK